MYKSIIKNTTIILSGQFVIGLLNILVVPVLIAQYGLYEYGLILLARIFLPSGIFSAFDPGTAENISQAVARSRSGRSWQTTKDDIKYILIINISIGIILACILFVISSHLGALLNVTDQYEDIFTRIIQTNAVFFIILFPLLIGEGLIKGVENFLALKMIEFITALIFLITVFLAPAFSFDMEFIVYTYLVCYLTRYLLFSIVGYLNIRKDLPNKESQINSDAESNQDIKQRIKLMIGNRLIGVSLNQLPTGVISALLSPASVAIFDTIMKIPRFCKLIASFMSSAIYPLAARLTEENAKNKLGKLGLLGSQYMLILTFSAFTGLAMFSKVMLDYWLGAEFVQHWVIFAFLFIVPIAVGLQGFISQIISVKIHYLKKVTRNVFIQAIAYWVFSLVFYNVMDFKAFAWATILGVLINLSGVLWMYRKELGNEIRILYTALVKNIALSIFFCMSLLHLSDYTLAFGIVESLLIFSLWMVLYIAIAYFLILTRDARYYLHKMITLK